VACQLLADEIHALQGVDVVAGHSSRYSRETRGVADGVLVLGRGLEWGVYQLVYFRGEKGSTRQCGEWKRSTC
jgi:hypothetical protein